MDNETKLGLSLMEGKGKEAALMLRDSIERSAAV